MADVKWIKITTDMFDNRKIKHLRRLPDGNNVVLIWVMLLTMAGRCNSGGMIFLTENIPYTPKMLADELDFEENTVILALEALEQLNMIVTDRGFFAIAGWEEHQNVDGLEKIREQNRLRQAKFKAKSKTLPGNVIGNVTVTQGNATEEEKEEDKEKEIDKDKKSVKETTHTLFKRLVSDYQLSASVVEKMAEWITYKVERKDPYKEQGLKSLLRQVENKCKQYGDQAVCSLIEECMANNWKGIIFDRLKQPSKQPYYQNEQRGTPTTADSEKMRRYLESMQNGEPKTAGNNEDIRRRAEELKRKLG